MKAQIDMVKLMRQTTMHVTVKRERELRWRVWLATKLILLAAMVMNCRIQFEGLGGSKDE